MKGKIFLVVLLSLVITSSLWALNTSFRLKGIFYLQNGWSGDGGTAITGGGGYPGRVSYNDGNGEILPNGTLSGSFWIGNVGWVTFDHGVVGSSAQLNCPTDILNNATQLCPISGSAWSQNSGWIVFGSSEIGIGSGAYYNPNTGNLEGWGWNKALGWVPLWSGLTGSTTPTVITPTDPLNGAPINFVSKIAIVGNIAGSRVFSVVNSPIVNQDVGYSYKTINHANILNMIRRNIALMSRNIDQTTLESVGSPHAFIIRADGSDYRIDSGWNVGTINSKRTIIIIGGDIILDQAYINSELWANRGIALIALQSSTGVGGNIIITNKVKQIYAYMYAEGTVYSGNKVLSTIIPYTQSGIWNVPQMQLYIRGFVTSKNTIGGAQQKPTPICPVLTPLCGPTTAYAYDWDYFRTYDPSDTGQSSLPSERSSVAKLKSAAMIIEYDANILIDPPPGFQEFQ
ncbi:hypothetical protein H7169_03880 [Candidatus Gracilibacteria bacterium]|nr:hypothetical protein [Candidatus Gracilibacteria bacterium]